MNSVRLGSRVYYKDNGHEDIGTIVDIVLDDRGPFIVKWDKQEESRLIEQEFAIPTLGIVHTVTINPADENVDGFTGSQLVLVTY